METEIRKCRHSIKKRVYINERDTRKLHRKSYAWKPMPLFYCVECKIILKETITEINMEENEDEQI